MYKQVFGRTYQIDNVVEHGSQAADVIKEIIDKENNESVRFVFTNWGSGFADGIGMNLQRKYGIHVDFEVNKDAKELFVIYKGK